MKPSRISNINNFNGHIDLKASPNSEMLSRQIENLRMVMRRMKTNESAKLDSIIDQKLRELK